LATASWEVYLTLCGVVPAVTRGEREEAGFWVMLIVGFDELNVAGPVVAREIGLTEDLVELAEHMLVGVEAFERETRAELVAERSR
jgi:hypothetical protein